MLIKRHSTIRSPRLAKKRKQQLWIKISVYVVAVLMFCAVPPLLSHIPALTIRDVYIEGNVVVSSTDIDAYVRKHITGSYLSLFSRANIFLYPKETIERGVLKDVPRLESVSISFHNMHSIDVVVKEREPLAVWCTQDNASCAFIDAQGVVFAQAPTFSGTLYTIYVKEDDGTFVLGDRVIDPHVFERLRTMVGRINGLGFSIERVSILTDGDIELHTVHGGVIMLSSQDDFDTVFGYIESLMNDPATIQNPDTFVSEFTYIDVRFGKKIFLK